MIPAPTLPNCNLCQKYIPHHGFETVEGVSSPEPCCLVTERLSRMDAPWPGCWGLGRFGGEPEAS